MTDTPEEKIVLDPDLKATAAESLLSQLKSKRGQDLTLDGSGVTFLSGACLQILLSGMETWRSEGATLTIATPSDQLITDAAMLGASDMLNFRMEEVA